MLSTLELVALFRRLATENYPARLVCFYSDGDVIEIVVSSEGAEVREELSAGDFVTCDSSAAT